MLTLAGQQVLVTTKDDLRVGANTEVVNGVTLPIDASQIRGSAMTPAQASIVIYEGVVLQANHFRNFKQAREEQA